MKKKLVSVVVAVYNVENYLEGCVLSILQQSYEKIEVILVDDGAKDRSGEICDEFSRQDKRVKVIHKKNAGLSAARNSGIKVAKGKYVMFVDGDDTIEPRMVEKLYNAAEVTGAEIAVCGYKLVPGGEILPEIGEKIVTLPGEEATKRLLARQKNIDVIAWNKLYLKKLFDNIQFPIGEIHEDNLTTYKLYGEATRVTYVPEALYDYWQRDDGITGAKSKKEQRAKIKRQAAMRERALKEAVEYFKERPELARAAKRGLWLTKLATLKRLISE